MLNRNPETLNEIRTVRNILAITRYYDVSQSFLDEAYDFIVANPGNTIKISNNLISFTDVNNSLVKTFNIQNEKGLAERILNSLTEPKIDGLVLTAKMLKIIPHYTSYSSSDGSLNPDFIPLLPSFILMRKNHPFSWT